MLTRNASTKAALERADAPQILHIANHGFFLEDQESKPSAENSADAADESTNPLLHSVWRWQIPTPNTVESAAAYLTALEASNLNLWGTKLVHALCV
ncbi:MAG TPA: hypothetical protein VFR24_26905 [Candidatus Angelobacter sp.]|nr:hypothetical protein [Candidatus Angelobacter sp.]